MRVLAVVIVIIGLVTLILGIMFIPQASSGEQEIKDSLAPLALDQVEEKYDAVSAKYNQLKAAEEPGIQANTAAPSSTYNYLASQRALLGLAKTNIGTVKVVRVMGIVDILVGLGLILAGAGLFKKSSM